MPQVAWDPKEPTRLSSVVLDAHRYFGAVRWPLERSLAHVLKMHDGSVHNAIRGLGAVRGRIKRYDKYRGDTWASDNFLAKIDELMIALRAEKCCGQHPMP